jgi:hypothetical protein
MRRKAEYDDACHLHFQGTIMAFSSSSSETAQPDRRQNLPLRQIFESAYVIIEPFFDLSADWGGQPLEFLAFQRLRENFPLLSHEDIHTLVTAARRVYGERHAG